MNKKEKWISEKCGTNTPPSLPRGYSKVSKEQVEAFKQSIRDYIKKCLKSIANETLDYFERQLIANPNCSPKLDLEDFLDICDCAMEKV